MRSIPYFAVGFVTLRSETRVGVSRISETGSRKRFGAIWHEPASVEVSDGSGGVKDGCMKRWDSITSTTYLIPRKRFPSDRSHNFGLKSAGARSAGNPHAT